MYCIIHLFSTTEISSEPTDNIDITITTKENPTDKQNHQSENKDGGNDEALGTKFIIFHIILLLKLFVSTEQIKINLAHLLKLNKCSVFIFVNSPHSC